MDDTETIFIVYPERRHVPVGIIADWFADAVRNGEIAPEFYDARSPEKMADALDDAGLITRGKS